MNAIESHLNYSYCDECSVMVDRCCGMGNEIFWKLSHRGKLCHLGNFGHLGKLCPLRKLYLLGKLCPYLPTKSI